MESRRKTLLIAISKTQGENESKLFQVLKNNYNEDIFSPTYSSDNRKENSVHINTSVGREKVDNLSTSRGSAPFVRHNTWFKGRPSEERPSSPILIGNQSIKQIEKAKKKEIQHLRSPPYNYSSPLLPENNFMIDNDFETEQLRLGSQSNYRDESKASLSSSYINSEGFLKHHNVSSNDKAAVILKNARMRRLFYKRRMTPDTKQTLVGEKPILKMEEIDLAFGSSIRQSPKNQLSVLPGRQAIQLTTSIGKNSNQHYEIDTTILSIPSGNREDTKDFFQSLMVEDENDILSRGETDFDDTDDNTSSSLDDDAGIRNFSRNQNLSFERLRQKSPTEMRKEVRRKSIENGLALSRTSLDERNNTKTRDIVFAEIKNKDCVINTTNSLHIQKNFTEAERISTNKNGDDNKNSYEDKVENQLSTMLATSDIKSPTKQLNESVAPEIEHILYDEKKSFGEKYRRTPVNLDNAELFAMKHEASVAKDDSITLESESDIIISEKHSAQKIVDKFIPINEEVVKEGAMLINDASETLEEKLDKMILEKPLWQKALHQISVEGKVSISEVRKSPLTQKVRSIKTLNRTAKISYNLECEDNKYELFASKSDPEFWEDTIHPENEQKESDSKTNRGIHGLYHVGHDVSKSADIPFEYDTNNNNHNGVDDETKKNLRKIEDEIFQLSQQWASNHYDAHLETPQVSNISKCHFAAGDSFAGNYLFQGRFGVASSISDSLPSDDESIGSPLASSIESGSSYEDSFTKPPFPHEIIIIEHSLSAHSNAVELDKVILEGASGENMKEAHKIETFKSVISNNNNIDVTEAQKIEPLKSVTSNNNNSDVTEAQKIEPFKSVTSNNNNSGCKKTPDKSIGLSKTNVSKYLFNTINGRSNNENKISGEHFMQPKPNSDAQCTLFNLNYTKRYNVVYPDGLKSILTNPSLLFHCTGPIAPNEGVSSPRETAFEDAGLGVGDGDGIQNKS